jgi:hydrogenase-4 membrane subunit HyfE
MTNRSRLKIIQQHIGFILKDNVINRHITCIHFIIFEAKGSPFINELGSVVDFFKHR